MLWTPDIASPPQLSEDAERSITLQVFERGVMPVANQALELLQNEDEAYADYLDRFGFELNRISSEGFWPERVLKVGAALTLLAYREASYVPVIDEETVNIGNTLAQLDGIPEAYLTALALDQTLGNLTGTILDAPDFSERGMGNVATGGYRQVLEIGAGCTRHYVQQAIAA